MLHNSIHYQSTHALGMVSDTPTTMTVPTTHHLVLALPTTWRWPGRLRFCNRTFPQSFRFVCSLGVCALWIVSFICWFFVSLHISSQIHAYSIRRRWQSRLLSCANCNS